MLDPDVIVLLMTGLFLFVNYMSDACFLNYKHEGSMHFLLAIFFLMCNLMLPHMSNGLLLLLV